MSARTNEGIIVTCMPLLLISATLTGCPRDSPPTRSVSPTATATLPTTTQAATAPPTLPPLTRLSAASVDELPPHASARFGTLRLNHSPLPFALAFSPDNAYLASCGSGAKIQIWDRRTGDNVRTLTAPAAATAIAWRSAGYQLVTISHDGSVITWDVATSTELHRFTITRTPNTPVAISASGRVAFFDAAGILQVVDSDDGRAITTLGPKVERTSERSERGKQAHVEQLAFARNGETLLSQTVRGVIHLHTIKPRPATQLPPTTMQTGRKFSATATVSDDGGLVAVDLGHSGLATIAIFDSATGKELRRFDAGTTTATSLVFGPNQDSLHVELFGGEVSDWSIAGTLLGNYNEQHRGQRLLARSSDGAWLATAGPSSTIRLWETSTRQRHHAVTELRQRGHDSAVVAAAFANHDADVVSLDTNGTLLQWAVATGLHRVEPSPRFGNPSALAVAHNAATVTIATADDGALTHALNSTATRAITPTTNQTERMSYSPDDSMLAMGNADNVEIWQVATGKRIAEFRTTVPPYDDNCPRCGDYVVALQWSTDGKQLSAISNQGTLTVYQRASRQAKRKLIVRGVVAATFAAVSPRWAVAVSEQIQVYDRGTKAILTIPTDEDASQLALSPDGKHIVIARDDAAIELWDIDANKLLTTWAGHRGRITSLAFSASGKQVVSASTDSTVMLWSVAE